MLCESGCVEAVHLIEFNDGWQVAEGLVSNEIQPASPRDDVMAHLVVLTGGEGQSVVVMVTTEHHYSNAITL